MQQLRGNANIVHRVADQRTPDQDSKIVLCDLCGKECWLARGAPETGQIVCTGCLGTGGK